MRRERLDVCATRLHRDGGRPGTWAETRKPLMRAETGGSSAERAVRALAARLPVFAPRFLWLRWGGGDDPQENAEPQGG
eukprot:8155950-Lingulodinium_polyedra.AAC.1